ncbi:DUF7694 domain-containing protein [Armatimonas rosea]|uniref:DUF7694 domain-containing protein n=1 Tax=Armatimonas rosea TaxID=685828 RepID=A0A7W9W9I3_ARMRO|nr:hypothetical protein [Armatimonas rosea]MBB6053326.1 hypothetical protein [Armatimonas rosea]
MAFKVPEAKRVTFHPAFGPMDISMGNNGVFELYHKATGRTLYCIASDGLGWEHVSVSVKGSSQTPAWADMNFVKDQFWGEEDAVMQLHPPKGDWINNHASCLHLWRPYFLEIPLPPSAMVGVKGIEPEDVERIGARKLREIASQELTGVTL